MLRRKGGYKHNGLSPMDVVLGIVLSILGLLVVLPFYNAIMISFVTEAEYFRTPFVFYPHAPTLEAYRTLLETGNILVGYSGNTLFTVAMVNHGNCKKRIARIAHQNIARFAACGRLPK